MTRMIDQWAQRLALQRVLIAILLVVIALFLLGVSFGVLAKMIEKGWPSRPFVPLIPLLALPLGIIGAIVAWRLVASPASGSAYERRYWKVWMLIMAIGIPTGLIGGAVLIRENTRFSYLFSGAPLSPEAAGFLAAVITVVSVVAIALYHRAIDDHEERAYLWGSQFAYYFLLVAFPAWWLLGRGGIVGPIDAGSAFIAILISVLVQAIIWAWLKFR